MTREPFDPRLYVKPLPPMESFVPEPNVQAHARNQSDRFSKPKPHVSSPG